MSFAQDTCILAETLDFPPSIHIHVYVFSCFAGVTEKDYFAEYSKSSRATCAVCKKKILQDELRIGKMVQSDSFDGRLPEYHHPECILTEKTVSSLL
jgi:hypothetical protein